MISAEISEGIKYMLYLGMQVGEIQVIYPNVSGSTIHRIAKKNGIEVYVRKKEGKRNPEIIKFLKKYVENNIDKINIVKVKLLISVLEKEIGEVQENMKTRLRIEVQETANVSQRINQYQNKKTRDDDTSR